MSEPADSPFAPLLAKAFDHASAREANAAIERVRAQLGGQVRSIEVVLPPGAGAQWLGTALLPKLVYHLESLGVRPPRYHGVFTSLFVGDELHFVHVKDLMELASGLLGLTADEMYARWGTQEARHAIDLRAEEPKKPGPILALPPGKPE